MTSTRRRLAIDLTPLAGAPTGVANFTRNVLRAARADGRFRVHGYLMSSRAPDLDVGLAVHRSRLPAALVQRLWVRLDWPSAPLVAGRADVIHATNFVAPPGNALVTVHDTGPLSHPELCTRAVARFGRLVLRAMDRGAWVHVTTERIADELEEIRPGSRERLTVVPLGLEPVPVAADGTGRRDVGADRYVLSLATTEARKNLPALVRAFAESAPPDVHLVLAGPVGPDEQAVTDAARETGLGPRFHRPGVVEPARRAALLRDAELLAYPSLEEGFGLPPLEALSVGVPVVATSTGALPELIGAEIPLLAPGDQAALVDALGDSLRSEPTVPESIAAVLATLDWETTGRRLLDVLWDLSSS